MKSELNHGSRFSFEIENKLCDHKPDLLNDLEEIMLNINFDSISMIPDELSRNLNFPKNRLEGHFPYDYKALRAGHFILQKAPQID